MRKSTPPTAWSRRTEATGAVAVVITHVTRTVNDAAAACAAVLKHCVQTRCTCWWRRQVCWKVALSTPSVPSYPRLALSVLIISNKCSQGIHTCTVPSFRNTWQTDRRRNMARKLLDVKYSSFIVHQDYTCFNGSLMHNKWRVLYISHCTRPHVGRHKCNLPVADYWRVWRGIFVRSVGGCCSPLLYTQRSGTTCADGERNNKVFCMSIARSTMQSRNGLRLT